MGHVFKMRHARRFASTSAKNPVEVVASLDRHVIGQKKAKKSVAVAVRERWRRSQVEPRDLRDEIFPMNILMAGPTGTGKTEIARRLAAAIEAPFVKVVSTKFTEVGIYGTDSESMVKDLARRALAQ